MKETSIRNLLTLLLVLTATGCATAGQKVVVQTSGQFAAVRTRPTILDLRLEKIVIIDVRMERALVELADAIASSTNGKLQFPIITENSRDRGDRIPKRDPKIRLEATNVTLKDVVDNLCRQSGWSYAKVQPGYLFTDDTHLFRKKN